mgnify:CR=1 FL=1
MTEQSDLFGHAKRKLPGATGKPTPAQISRMDGTAGQFDLFSVELVQAVRVHGLSLRYERGKRVVDLDAQGVSDTYELGIKALTRRIRY